MKTTRKTNLRKSSGFSLIELMIAVSIFVVIGGATMSLFKQHAQMFTSQQNQITLNISLRNALTQLQTDVVNAGSGYYATAASSSFPVGLTVQNVAGGFDTINIVSPDATVLPVHPDGPGGHHRHDSGNHKIDTRARRNRRQLQYRRRTLVHVGGHHRQRTQPDDHRHTNNPGYDRGR
jgi:prepilin-type N-terminal cleavage/methylation domain-containing protein